MAGHCGYATPLGTPSPSSDKSEKQAGCLCYIEKGLKMLKKYFMKYADFVNGRNHLWVTLGYFCFAILITITFIYFPDIRKTHPMIFKIMNIPMVFFPILIVIANIISFQTTLSSLKKLASLYLQVILMFGVIYYFGTASSVANEYRNFSPAPSKIQSSKAAISGVDTDWVKLAIDGHSSKQEILTEALISFQDCIHFSLITSTTVGYGDLVPKSPVAKLLVDLQVLVSCFLLAFGVGSFFNSDKKSVEEKITRISTELNQRLSDIEKKLDQK
jgi:Ion channel